MRCVGVTIFYVYWRIKMSWTEDRVDMLKNLWGDGHTAAEIAKKLGGVTRNAVIGKAHRLKLSNRVSPIQNKKPANKNIARSKPSLEKMVKPASAPKGSSIIAEKQASFIPDNLYSLMDLKPRQCRWPSGDPREEGFGFCGDKTISGIPYCEEHAKLAYQAATRNRILNNTANKGAKNTVGDNAIAKEAVS